MTPRAEVKLSTEELVYLLTLLSIPSLPGLPPDLRSSLDGKLFEALMGSAERSLRARDFLRFEDQSLIIESVLMGILGFCARDNYSIVATRTLPDDQHRTLFYHLRDTLRIRRHEELGVHHFGLLPDVPSALQDILSFVQGETPMPEDCPPFSAEVNAMALFAVRLLGAREESKRRAARLSLEQQNMPAPLVEALSHLTQENLVASITISQLRALPNEPALAWGAFQAQDGWWTMTPIGDIDAGRYQLERVGQGRFQIALETSLMPYLTRSLQ